MNQISRVFRSDNRMQPVPTLVKDLHPPVSTISHHDLTIDRINRHTFGIIEFIIIHPRRAKGLEECAGFAKDHDAMIIAVGHIQAIGAIHRQTRGVVEVGFIIAGNPQLAELIQGQAIGG